MPKSFNHEGLIPLQDAGSRTLRRLGLENHPVARARARDRLVRAALDRRSDLAVWVGARLYVLDDPQVLDALANELGVLQPPVMASNASLPSSMDVAA